MSHLGSCRSRWISCQLGLKPSIIWSSVLVLLLLTFTELPDNCFTKLTKLVTLSAAYNAITRLQDGLFDGLQSLVNLDLSYNHIAFIGLRVFSNSSDLTRLRLMNLSYNKLTSLEPWPYYRCILGTDNCGVEISLRGNLISNFTNELNFRFGCGMKRPYCKVDLYDNRIIRIMDLFNGWNIAGRSLFIKIICFRNMKGSHPKMTFNIGGDSYICDCTDYLFYKTVKVIPAWSGVLDGVRCHDPKYDGGIGKLVLAKTIPLNKFVCDQPDRCPSSCRCAYRPANGTLHVYCSAANLSSLPLDLPPLPKNKVKYKLDFSNNKLLRRLDHRPYFVNSSILDVSNCGLTAITMTVLKDVSRMSLINFRGNMLESFPRQADTVNISARLLIGNNPWRCSCDNSWMIGWLQSLFHQVSDPGDITCASPSRMRNRYVLKSTKEDVCVDPVKHALTITLSSVVAVVVLLITAGIVVYKLRVKLYRRWKFHPFDRDECVGEDMDYDVFLCCSSRDDNLHGNYIQELLEDNGYRVCYHERDFLPGQVIEDNIARSIERSKRTVCLISNNFLQR